MNEIRGKNFVNKAENRNLLKKYRSLKSIIKNGYFEEKKQIIKFFWENGE